VYRLCISYDLTIPTELAVEPVAERKFNDAARQYFDVYAWLLPYRVSVMERTGNSAASKSVVPQESHKELKQTPAGAYKSTTSLDLSRSSTEPRESRLVLPELRSRERSSCGLRFYLVAPILVTPPPSFVTQTLLPSNATISGLTPTG